MTSTLFELSVRWIPLFITVMFFLQTDVLCRVTRLYRGFLPRDAMQSAVMPQ